VTKITTAGILGTSVWAHSMPSLLAHMEELIAAPGCAVAYAVNAHALNLTYHHPDYLQALRRADLVYADGASIRLAARLLGSPVPEKLTTTDVWPYLCTLALQRGYRFFLLGGEEGLAERAKARALAQYPRLQITGTHHGYFAFEDERVISLINAARPHVLWVGMGDPRQVLWAERAKKLLTADLVVTCGGMFKLVAGELQRTSPYWRQRGFEWLYRLIQEPQTWRRYLLGLPVFAARVLAQRFFRHRVENANQLSPQ
jgi:N-acetylglucosaminyldiphosphoundecaprenol N-acetyl-beta-D-mannosaminyltransferase